MKYKVAEAAGLGAAANATAPHCFMPRRGPRPPNSARRLPTIVIIANGIEVGSIAQTERRSGLEGVAARSANALLGRY
jgi:hypothetical protein